MCLLGLDFGERRIGLALSDPQGEFALPWKTLIRENDRRAIEQVAGIVQQEGVTGLVLGEPLQADGSRGQAARRVRRFGERLQAATGLPLTFVDETLTTVEAESRLRQSGVDPLKDPARVDAVAAQILLQEALDERRRLRE